MAGTRRMRPLRRLRTPQGETVCIEWYLKRNFHFEPRFGRPPPEERGTEKTTAHGRTGGRRCERCLCLSPSPSLSLTAETAAETGADSVFDGAATAQRSTSTHRFSLIHPTTLWISPFKILAIEKTAQPTDGGRRRKFDWTRGLSLTSKGWLLLPSCPLGVLVYHSLQ